MKTFKLRASAGGKFLPKGRGGTPIGETGKTHVKEWLIEQIYEYRRQIDSKYINKGNDYEDLAIDYAIQKLDIPFTIKNEDYFEDDYFSGTPDLILSDRVIDIKCSWDCYTFPLFQENIPNKDYEAQLQIYMHLTGIKIGTIAYVLLSHDEDVSYDHLEPKYRIKTYDVVYSEEYINELKIKIDYAREFAQEIIKNI